MILARPSQISSIDKYASDVLGIPTRELMRRAGDAVARTVRTLVQKGKRVSVFAGKGNNGGDGYAAALALMDDYDVCVYDVFSSGQRSEEGRYFLDAFASSGGRVTDLEFDDRMLARIQISDCVIDAVFGTGFVGEYPEVAEELAKIFRGLDAAVKIAIDLPLGVNADVGTVESSASYRADVTVALGFVKPGLVSYPAKEYVGNLVFDNIGLQIDDFKRDFAFNYHYIDGDLAASLIPKRPQNSNKGTFGKLLAVTGSPAFPGAAHLSLEAALRGGAGYVTYLGHRELCDSLIQKFPEAVYRPLSLNSASLSDIESALELSHKHTAILVGSGSSVSEGLFTFVERLLLTEGGPAVLDADAINVLSKDPRKGRELLARAKRQVILTPHPLELSRLTGIQVDRIQSDRLALAVSFAYEHNCILVLKGAATVVTNGKEAYINSSGSSALAKAGSGDVLAGLLASLVASGSDPLSASALSVYLHGLAADTLAKELSTFGVIPSDLPREIARLIAKTVTV